MSNCFVCGAGIEDTEITCNRKGCRRTYKDFERHRKEKEETIVKELNENTDIKVAAISA